MVDPDLVGEVFMQSLEEKLGEATNVRRFSGNWLREYGSGKLAIREIRFRENDNSGKWLSGYRLREIVR